MFNRTFVSTPAPTVHVHNEMKPHDAADAARLYGELEEKARREVSEATVVKFGAQNELTAVVIHLHKDLARDQQQARVLFDLNGTHYDLMLEPDTDAIQLRLYREVAQKLVGDILRQMNPRIAR